MPGSSPVRIRRLNAAYSGSVNRCTVSSVTAAVGCAQATAWSRTPPRPTAGSWCRSPDERDACAGLVGDGQEGSGGVLVEHPGLVDEQQVTGPEPGAGTGSGVRLSGPVAVAVPAPPVLVDQPGGGVPFGAGLGGGDLRGLQRRCHHHQSTTLLREQFLRRAQGGGLSGTGRAFDHDQGSIAGQGPDDGRLGRVDPDQSPPADACPAGWPRSPARDPGDEIRLDLEDPRRGQSDRTCSGTSARWSSVTHRSAARAVMSSASSARVAGSARRQVWARRTSVLPRMSAVFQADRFAPRIETHQLGCGVAVDPPRPRPSESHGCGRVGVAELAQLLVPAGHQLSPILRDDLVRASLRPRPSVPRLPELRTRLLPGMLGPPGGLVALDVAADLPGPGAERTHVRHQLADLVGLRVDG